MLPGCIASLRSQTYPQEAYEIIVVDNNSTDDTPQVIQRLNQQPGKQIRYVLEKKSGLMEARHAGARIARGDILAYTDDDAIADPGWIAALSKAYDEMDADCAGGKILIRWDRPPPKWVLKYEGALAKIDLGSKMRLLEPPKEIYGPNFSIRKNRLFEIGGFNPDQIGQYLIGDGETGLCHKVHAAGWRIVWVPDALVWHLQYVAKNATLRDLQRRYANNGVCTVYAMFKSRQIGLDELVTYAKEMRVRAMRRKIGAFLHLLFRKQAYYDHKMAEAYYQSQAECALKLAQNADYRQLVMREDWINIE